MLRGARETMAAAMANAMVRMMEAMGLFGGGSYGSWGGLPAISGLAAPYGSMMGMPGVSPWGMPMQDPSKALGTGTDMMRQMYPGMPGAGAGGRGVGWTGSGRVAVGISLIVQGGRYRIYAPQDQPPGRPASTTVQPSRAVQRPGRAHPGLRVRDPGRTPRPARCQRPGLPVPAVRRSAGRLRPGPGRAGRGDLSTSGSRPGALRTQDECRPLSDRSAPVRRSAVWPRGPAADRRRPA